MLNTIITALLFVGCITALSIILYDVFDQWVEDIVERRLSHYGDQVHYWRESSIAQARLACRYREASDRYEHLWHTAEQQVAQLKADYSDLQALRDEETLGEYMDRMEETGF